MGRKGSGVEVRDRSIRLHFMFEGVRRFPTLMLNGASMLPTAPNIKYAHRLAAEIRDRIRHGTFELADYFPASGSPTPQLTVAEHLEGWKAAQRLEASTLAGYSSAIRFWRGAAADKRMTPLGSIGLKTLTHTHILTALASRPDLSGKTINNYVSVLHEALQLAVREKALADNPADAVPRAKVQKDPPDPFTRAEVDAIVADALAHYPEPVGNLIEWWAFSGVRTSEAQGLRWPSVDLASDYVQVHEAIVRGVSKSTTKTAVSRNVILNSRAKAAILRQAKHTRMAGEHVWLDPRYGTPWLEERAFRRSYWTPTLKRLGIRYRRPYCLRHTYATMMLMAGMKPAFCAKQLGHSIEMFHRTYARWIDGDRDALEMDRLEATISQAALATGAR